MEATVKAASFNIAIQQLKPTVKREFTFSNGDEISFSITLDADSSSTVIDLHKRSIEAAIALLQSTIKR